MSGITTPLDLVHALRGHADAFFEARPDLARPERADARVADWLALEKGAAIGAAEEVLLVDSGPGRRTPASPSDEQITAQAREMLKLAGVTPRSATSATTETPAAPSAPPVVNAHLSEGEQEEVRRWLRAAGIMAISAGGRGR